MGFLTRGLEQGELLMTTEKTYYSAAMGRQINVDGPFDRLPQDLKTKFVDVFYDELRDAVSGAAAHATVGTSDFSISQMEKIIEFAKNPVKMAVLQELVEAFKAHDCH